MIRLGHQDQSELHTEDGESSGEKDPAQTRIVIDRTLVSIILLGCNVSSLHNFT